MTRTWWRSARLGMGATVSALRLPAAVSDQRLVAVAFDELLEAVEQVVRVVRAGRRLGVVLHGERRRVKAAQPLDDVVVEAGVAHLDTAEVGGRHAVQRRVHGEAVVVRGDLDLAGGAVEHRLVDAAVPVAELVGAEAEGAAEDLAAEI